MAIFHPARLLLWRVIPTTKKSNNQLWDPFECHFWKHPVEKIPPTKWGNPTNPPLLTKSCANKRKDQWKASTRASSPNPWPPGLVEYWPTQGSLLVRTQTSCTIINQIPQIYPTYALLDPPFNGPCYIWPINFSHSCIGNYSNLHGLSRTFSHGISSKGKFRSVPCGEDVLMCFEKCQWENIWYICSSNWIPSSPNFLPRNLWNIHVAMYPGTCPMTIPFGWRAKTGEIPSISTSMR